MIFWRPPGESTPNFDLRSAKLVGIIRVSKKMTFINRRSQQELWRNSRFALFVIFAIAKRQKTQKRPFFHKSNWDRLHCQCVSFFLLTLMVQTSFLDCGQKLGVLSLGWRPHSPPHKVGEKLQNWPLTLVARFWNFCGEWGYFFVIFGVEIGSEQFILIFDTF